MALTGTVSLSVDFKSEKTNPDIGVEYEDDSDFEDETTSAHTQEESTQAEEQKTAAIGYAAAGHLFFL